MQDRADSVLGSARFTSGAIDILGSVPGARLAHLKLGLRFFFSAGTCFNELFEPVVKQGKYPIVIPF